MKRRIAVLLIAVSLLLIPVAQANPTWDYRNDGFHPSDPYTDPAASYYFEWQYFNFIDYKTGYSGIFAFALGGNILTDGIGTTLFELENIYEQKLYTEFPPDNTLPISEVSYRTDYPEIYVGSDFAVLEDGIFHIHLERTGLSTAILDLYYIPEVEPSEVYDVSLAMTYFPSWMQWTVPSIRNVVYGTLTIDGVVYTIDQATGYHDHNWGDFIWGDNWCFDWAQISSYLVGLDGSVHHTGWSIDMAVMFDGSRTTKLQGLGMIAYGDSVLESFNDVSITYSDFTTLDLAPELGSYPAKAQYVAISDNFKVVADINVLGILPVLPTSLPGTLTVIWEFISLFSVTIYYKLPFIGYVPISWFASLGFNEYVTVMQIA